MKYDNLPPTMVNEYINRLIGRVYKILPMKESESRTLDTYINSLIRELLSNYDSLENDKNRSYFLELIGTLSSLPNQNDITLTKSDVFKCISIINNILKTTVESGDPNE